MDSSDLTRLARWAIPGWIVVISFLLFVAVDTATAGYHTARFHDVISKLIHNKAELTSASAVVAVLSGVPLGFLTYQLYFFVRWNSPVSNRGLLPPVVAGRHEDLRHMLQDIQDDELALGESWRREFTAHKSFNGKHDFTWRYVDNLLFEACHAIDRGDKSPLYERLRYVLTLLHVLGAGAVGICLGFAAYGIAVGLTSQSCFVYHIIGGGILFALLLAFLAVEDRLRRQGQRLPTMPQPAKDDWLANAAVRFAAVEPYPASLLICALVAAALLVGPIGRHLADREWFALAITMLGAGVLLGLARTAPLSKLFTIAVTIALIGVCYAISVHWPRDPLSLDWPFIHALLLVCVLVVVMVQNKNNTRDELLSIQYYVLRRYLGTRDTQHQQVD